MHSRHSRHSRIGLAAIIALAAWASAAAQVPGGSNFGSFAYPPHGCGGAPLLPVRPENMASVRAVEAYNREVDAYNSRIEVYSDCIRAYVARASADVERIRERAADASATLNVVPRPPR